ncbi:MAG TPA: penicillin-binding transpeptidase domain-containing protein [Kofleriaceae bacterium]|jgi:cell division protein FtsI/penicillin-binding protein 2
MRRRTLVLAGSILVAGVAAIAGHKADHAASIASIPSSAAGDPAVLAKLADQTVMPTEAPAPLPVPIPKPETGEAVTAAAPSAVAASGLDLDHITRVGDHYEAPIAGGKRAVLTLDPELQQLAEHLLDESRAPRGAIVAMAPDGRILALAGRRTEATRGSRTGTFDWHLATDVWAPAASVFKLVTASALVSAGVDPDDKVCFHGGIRSVTESNLVDGKHDSRCESLTYGVAHSNNAILGKLAFQKLDPTALAKTAADLALSAALPVGGSAGHMDLPTTHDLSFAQAAAGFAGSQLSVVGGALLAATFADDGEQPVPHLVASIDGVAQPELPRRRALPVTIARAVGKMMVATCDLGSAASSFGKHRDIRVAGKTGTLARSEPFFMEHSWFVGYAPYEKPEIIVSVLLGNPEDWHLHGHQVARRLIDQALHATSREKDRAEKTTLAKHIQW